MSFSGRVDLAVAVADGAECISDIAVLADQPGLFGPVASDSTVWRLLAQLGDRQLAGVAAARAAAREVVWAQRAEVTGAAVPPATAAGVELPGLVLDVDATVVVCHSEKEQAAPTFKGGFGFHPVRREALTIRAGVRGHRRRPCRSRAVKLRAS